VSNHRHLVNSTVDKCVESNAREAGLQLPPSRILKRLGGWGPSMTFAGQFRGPLSRM